MKNKKTKKQIEEDKEKSSLNQEEAHDFGRLVLKRINSSYESLKSDPDMIWTLEDDIELFYKLSIMVVNLQNGKKLRVEKNEKQKSRKSN